MLRTFLTIALLFPLLRCLVSAQSRPGSGNGVAVEHVNVIPMNVEKVLTDQTVLISGARIARIGRSSEIAVPPETKIIDARGEYLIPGLIDSHVHLYSRQHFSLYLANGVTTVFNLNGAPLHLKWRDEIAAGRMLGPRAFTVGPKFDRADSPPKAAELVEQYWKAGYDGIKIYNQVSKEEYPVLIATARKHNMLTVGHIAPDPGFEETLKQGQAIAHAEEYLYTFFKDHPRDLSLIPQAVSMTKSAGVPVIATLVTYRNIVDQAVNFAAYVHRPEMEYWAPWELEDIKDPSNNPYLSFESYELHNLQMNYPFLKILVNQLHAAGVPILVGTDGGGVANVPGFSLHDEMEILVRSGFTPFEALRSATIAPARFLKQEQAFGTIEPGKVADLVLLKANPLDQISNTREIAGVFVKGKWLPQEDLQGTLRGLPASYAHDEQEAESKLVRDPSQAVAFLKTVDPFFDNLATAVVKQVALRNGAKALEKIMHQARESDAGTPLDTPEFVNSIADYLMGKQKEQDAVDLFRFNTTEHPQAAIAWDRLARAYYKLGDNTSALQFYKRALEVDPGYWNAEFAQRRVKDLTTKLGSEKPDNKK